MKQLSGLVVLFAIYLSAPAMAHHVSNHKDKQVETQTSQPGYARMTVAVAASNIEIEFYTQTVNVLGFNGVAESPEQKALLQDSVAWLSRPENIFAFPEKAACHTIVAEVNSVIIDGKTKAGDNTSPEFDGYYIFECDTPSELDEITVKLFDQYDSFKEIQVKRMGAGSAAYVTLTAEQNRLELK